MHITLKPNALVRVDRLLFMWMWLPSYQLQSCFWFLIIKAHLLETFWLTDTALSKAYAAFWYLCNKATSLDSSPGFLDLVLLSYCGFLFSFFNFSSFDSCSCITQCMSDSVLVLGRNWWTKQTTVPVLIEFAGSKSRFCVRCLQQQQQSSCWHPTMPVSHAVSGNIPYKFKGKQLPWRPCDLLPAEVCQPAFCPCK